MPHARIYNRTDGKFELETRFRNQKLRDQLAFTLPTDMRVFDNRLGEHGRWVLSDAVRPYVLAILSQLNFETEMLEPDAQSSKPPAEASPEERLSEVVMDTPDLPAP